MKILKNSIEQFEKHSKLLSAFNFLLAPTGALSMDQAGHFLNVHSDHQCSCCYKSQSKSLKQYQCKWCHKIWIDADLFRLMLTFLVDTDWCWVFLLGSGWCWLMLMVAEWCWLMLFDTDWCRLMMIGADWYWLMLIDEDWCHLMLIDSAWLMLKYWFNQVFFCRSIHPVIFPMCYIWRHNFLHGCV